MASYNEGYDEERFMTTVDRNFHCLICLNVLKDPVLCQRNQHCFCRGCITKHLENLQRCPTCADELTVETFAEPQRMIKDYLNELNIHCEHVDKGCPEILQLQHLDHHEATCDFKPAVCRNKGCGVSVSKHDLIRHETELCEFQEFKCRSCGEMKKTLDYMEERMAKMEASITNIEGNMNRNVQLSTVVNDEVVGLKAAMIEGFDEMKGVFAKMEDMKEGNTRKLKSPASGSNEKETSDTRLAVSTMSFEGDQLLSTQKWMGSYVYMRRNTTGNVRGWKEDPGKQGHWIFTRIASTDKYLLSTREWPNRYMYMQGTADGNIRGHDKDPGPQGHWMITQKGSVIVNGRDVKTYVLNNGLWPKWYMYMQNNAEGNVRGWNGDPGIQGYFIIKQVVNSPIHINRDGSSVNADHSSEDLVLL